MVCEVERLNKVCKGFNEKKKRKKPAQFHSQSVRRRRGRREKRRKEKGTQSVNVSERKGWDEMDRMR